MDYIETLRDGDDLIVNGVLHFCLDDILDCGQCFRWDKLSAGLWRGIAHGRCRTVRQENTSLRFYGVTQSEFDEVWYNYFDFGRNYGSIKQVLSKDPAMKRAVEFSPGMRVLRQEPWEALCSFILSQNNNIKRIRGIVSRLCESFGEPVDGGFAFPVPQKLAALSPDDLAPVRCGFRAAYVIDAAKKVTSGELDLPGLRTMPVDLASAELQKIHGVGPKVAACALLYGFARADVIPVDVWIKRALATFYPDGMPCGITEIVGLGQQYLFHYVRNNTESLEIFP